MQNQTDTGSAEGLLLHRPSRPALWAVGIFLTALALRLLHIWQIREAPFFSVLLGDARGYDEWAQRIAGGDWFGNEVFYQAPLYPYFLGILYSLFGHNLLIVRLVQAVIGASSAVLLGLATWRLLTPRAGLFAGFAMALYAPAIFFDGLLQKAVLDVFFICLVLWILSGCIPAPQVAGHSAAGWAPTSASRGRWIALGVAMGALSLTRENALVLVAVLALWALVGRPRTTPGTRGTTPVVPAGSSWGVGAAAAFALGLAIALVPVAARNYAIDGGFYLTTSQFGPNFFIGNNPRSDGTYASLRPGRGAPEYERQDATDLAELGTGRRLSPAEVSSYWTGRALDFITTQPGAWLRLMGRKVLLLVNADEMLDTESQETYAEWSLPVRVLGWVGHFGILVPLAALGMWTLWPQRRRLWVIYAMTIAYAASVVMFYVFARYRFPLVPFFLIFWGAAVSWAWEFLLGLSGRGQGTEAPAATWLLTAVGAIAVLSNWPVLSSSVMRAVTENNLATVLQAEGRVDEAVSHYERAIAIDPAYAPAYNNLGTALKAKGDLDGAVATYRRALEVMSDYPDAHYNLANALIDQKKPEEAGQHFRIALRSIPGEARVHNNLGIALAAEGKLDEAIAEFEIALTTDPRSAIAHRNLGSALASRGRVEDALRHLRQGVELAPNDPAMHYDLGSVLLESSNFHSAAAAFRQTLALDPKHVGAHNNLGIALASQNQLDEAISHFQQALKLEPGFPDAQRNLALAIRAKGR